MEAVVQRYTERKAAREREATGTNPLEGLQMRLASTPAADAEAERIMASSEWWSSHRRTPEMISKVEAYHRRRAARQSH